MRFFHRANDIRLNQLHRSPVGLIRVNLNAHLRGDIRLRGCIANQARFVDIVCKRLFAIDVLAQLECGECRVNMRVLADGDDHGIKRLGLVEHLAEVRIRLGPLVPCRGLAQVTAIHVAKGGDVFGLGDFPHVTRPAATAAHDGDINLAVEIATPNKRGSAGEKGCSGRGLDKRSASNRSSHGEAPGWDGWSS